MPTERGFTLIEVLVALVVTGLLLALVVNGAVLAREQQARAVAQREAITLGMSVLAQAAAESYQPGRREDALGRYRWTVDERAALVDPRGIVVLAELAVAVRGPSGTLLFRGARRKLKRVPQP